MQTYKLTISFSKGGDYFDYEVKWFEVTLEVVRFIGIRGEHYSFDLDMLHELTIGVTK